jgi:hypothetical protein
VTAVTIRRIARLASWLDLLAEQKRPGDDPTCLADEQVAAAMAQICRRTAPGGGSYPAGIGLPHVLLHVCALLGLMASYEAADTIVGKVDYAPNGEWKNPRVLWVQYPSRSAGSNSSRNPAPR